MKFICAALLCSAGFAAASVARADDGGQSAVDVDALEKQYKGMPGGDMIVKQLEANRAKIAAGNKKAAAARSSAAAAAGGGPAKGFSDLLAMIPPPPKTVAEAMKRLGKVGDGSLNPKRDGDLKSEAAMAEVTRQMMTPPAPAASQSPRALAANQGDVLRDLSQRAQAVATRGRALSNELLKSGSDAKAEMDKAVQAVEAAYAPKIDAACNGTSAGADNGGCPAVYAERNGKMRARRGDYLVKRGQVVADARGRTKALLAEAAAVHAKAKDAFGDEASMPGAATLLGSMDSGARQLLGTLASVNDDMTVAAAVKDYAGK